MLHRILAILVAGMFAANAAQTPSALLSTGKAFAALNQHDLQIAQLAILMQLTLGGTVSTPSTLLANGRAFQQLSDHDLSLCQVVLLNQLTGGSSNFLALSATTSANTTNSVGIGSPVLPADITHATNGVAIGGNSLGNGDGVAIGAQASADPQCISIGGFTFAINKGIAIGDQTDAQGTNSIAIGQAVYPGDFSILIGSSADLTSHTNIIAIGNGTGVNQATADNITVIGNKSPNTTKCLLLGPVTGDTGFIAQNGSYTTTAATGVDAVGTDTILAGGNSTGLGRAGAVRERTAISGSAGSTANTLVDRTYISAKAVALTQATATSVLTFTVANNKTAGVLIFALTSATDGTPTDYQAQTDFVSIAAENKAGTILTTVSASAPAANQKSAGTLTTAWTTTVSGNTVTVKNNANSSLTSPTIKCLWQITACASDDATFAITPQ